MNKIELQEGKYRHFNYANSNNLIHQFLRFIHEMLQYKNCSLKK